MVIGRIREALEKRKQRRIEEEIEKNRLESYRETEQMQKAEQIKKEADRLAHLKQYKHAIDEYNKALEIFPYNEKELMFKKPAEFFFKIYYNIAASYSYMNKLNDSIVFFDKGGPHYAERDAIAAHLYGAIDIVGTGRDRIDPVTGRFDFSVTDEDKQEAERDAYDLYRQCGDRDSGDVGKFSIEVIARHPE